jgi:hypothetical protein
LEEQPDSEPSFPDILWEEITFSSRSIQKALDLAGAWSDMDWDVVEQELYRIRHETGKPVSWDFLESMIETLEVMNDAELMASIRRGIQDMAEGRYKPWEDVKRELGLE